MPYPTLDSLPENVKALSKKKQEQWRAIWESAYERAKADGKSDKEAERSAFAQANGVVFKNAAEPNAEYLTKLKDLIRKKVKDGDLSDDDVLAIIRAAAGYAGGKARARNRSAAGEAGSFAIEAAEDGSLWVGYWLHPDDAAKLAIPSGEPAEQLHLTLVWLGKADDLPADAVERVQSAVRAFALSRREFPVKISGAARFEASHTSDAKDVIYAVVDSHDVETLRMDLCFALAQVGIPYPWGDHEYCPHVTLAYVDPGQDISPFPLPNLTVAFDSLTVSTSKDVSGRTTYPLKGPRVDAYGAPLMMAEFIEPPQTIAVLPTPGVYTHPKWGDLDLTEDRIDNFIAQFQNEVYQDRLPIDLEHDLPLSGAAGWITDLIKNADGSVDAVVDWTDRGVEVLRRDRFAYVSPAWYDAWDDPVTGKTQEDILIGAALTVRPFFKPKVLRPLAASEDADPTPEVTRMPDDKPNNPQPQPAPVMASEEALRRLSELESANAKLTADLSAEHAAREASDTQAKTLAERITAMEDEAQTRRFMAEVTGASESNNVRWYGEPEANVALLKHLASTATGGEDSEIFKNTVAQQRALGEQMRNSSLFKPAGTDQTGGADDPQGQITTMAQKRATEKGIGIGEATRQIVAEHPDLARRAGEQAAVRV